MTIPSAIRPRARPHHAPTTRPRPVSIRATARKPSSEMWKASDWLRNTAAPAAMRITLSVVRPSGERSRRSRRRGGSGGAGAVSVAVPPGDAGGWGMGGVFGAVGGDSESTGGRGPPSSRHTSRATPSATSAAAGTQ